MTRRTTYHIRRVTRGAKNGYTYLNSASIAVPNEIAKKIPPDVEFSVELTDDGLLYRPVTRREQPS